MRQQHAYDEIWAVVRQKLIGLIKAADMRNAKAVRVQTTLNSIGQLGLEPNN